MKFYNNDLNIKMDLQKGKTNILEIESYELFRKTIFSINNSVISDNEEWIFSNEDNILKKSTYVDIVNSPFMLEFDNRKIQKMIQDDLYNLSMSEANYEKTQNLLNNIEKYILDMEWQLPYNIDVTNMEIKNIFKNVVSGIDVSEDFVERFNRYIQISARVLKSKILVFVDLMKYFNNDEWKQIEKTTTYEGIYILCIECSTDCLEANKITIDFDGCQIV